MIQIDPGPSRAGVIIGRVQLKIQKIQKVFFIEKDIRQCAQVESIAARYMNWFAINEDDQFEIASIQTKHLSWLYDPIAIEKVIVFSEFKTEAIEAVENLRKQENKGKDYFYRIQEIVFNRFFIEKNAWLFVFERYGKSHLSQEWTRFSLRLKSVFTLS